MLQRKIDGASRGAVEDVALEGSRGKEGASWQTTENAVTRPVYTMNVGRAKAKKFLRDAEKEKQEGIFKATGMRHHKECVKT